MGHYTQGKPYMSGSTWQRDDLYHSEHPDLNDVADRVFVAGKDDLTPIHNDASGYGGEYNAKCSCCYLGFAHSEAFHLKSKGGA